MSEHERKVDLGLAEFVAKLISETFDALATSLVDQANKHLSLVEISLLELDEFAAGNVSDEEVESRLVVLFPSDQESGHRVVAGERYVPSEEDGHGEDPPFSDVLGVRLGSRDFRRRGADYRLTSAGVDRIMHALRLLMARPRFDSLAALARGGIPKVVIDSGRISSKVTFEIHDLGAAVAVETETAAARTAGPPEASLLSGRRALLEFGALPIKSWAPPNVRMVVKQADSQAPQAERSGQVYGEVEITFKTVQ